MILTDRKCCHYALTWTVLAVIVVLTLMPSPPTPEEAALIPHFDKIVHFLMFGGLSTVWWWEYSLRRGYPAAPWRALWPIAVAVSLLGGLDELMQGWLTADRSADFYDWVADTLGAFALPALGSRIVNLLLPDGVVRLETAARPAEITDELGRLYHDAFPPEERRSWDDIVRFASSPAHPLQFTLVTRGGEPVGFITWWQFSRFRYVEHFAVAESLRGSGIGARALREFVGRRRDPVVLEVEPASQSAMARRRIGFYQRCGFSAHPEYSYIQPPYAEGLPSVPLMLMTAPGRDADAEVDVRSIDRTLKVMVYKTDPE